LRQRIITGYTVVLAGPIAQINQPTTLRAKWTVGIRLGPKNRGLAGGALELYRLIIFHGQIIPRLCCGSKPLNKTVWWFLANGTRASQSAIHRRPVLVAESSVF